MGFGAKGDANDVSTDATDGVAAVKRIVGIGPGTCGGVTIVTGDGDRALLLGAGVRDRRGSVFLIMRYREYSYFPVVNLQKLIVANKKKRIKTLVVSRKKKQRNLK